MILGDLHVQNDGILGAALGAVAVEIAQRIGHQEILLLIQGNLVNHVGVGTDDDVHAFLLHQGDDALLGIIDGIVVLRAPMEHGDGHIRPLRGYAAQDFSDSIGIHIPVGTFVVHIELIDAILAALRQAQRTHTLGEGHHRHGDTLYLADGIALGFTELLRRGEGAHGLDARGTDIIQGLVQTDQAVIDGVGIGHLQDIHTGTCQRVHQLLGGGTGIGAIGFAYQNTLKIHHGQIRVGQHMGHIYKCLGIIITQGGSAGSNHQIRHIQVARSLDMDGGHTFLRGLGGNFLGRRLGHGNAGGSAFAGGSLAAAISGQSENRRATDYDHRSGNDQPYLQFTLLLELLLPHLFPPLPALIHFIPVKGHRLPSFSFWIYTLFYYKFRHKTRG